MKIKLTDIARGLGVIGFVWGMSSLLSGCETIDRAKRIVESDKTTFNRTLDSKAAQYAKPIPGTDNSAVGWARVGEVEAEFRKDNGLIYMKDSDRYFTTNGVEVSYSRANEMLRNWKPKR